MKKILLALFIGLMVFSVGCGAGPGIRGIGGGGANNSKYSNASFNGSYVYRLSGTDVSSGVSAIPYEEAGVLTADGNGHITAGIDDFTEGTTSSLGNTITGTYSIAGNGTGSIAINGNGFSFNLAVTLASASRVYLVEADALNAAGVAELQSASAIGAAPTGTFVFKVHTTSGQGSTSTVGQATVNAGIFQSGSVDVNQFGAASSPTLTSFTFNAPTSNGRGTGNFVETSGTPFAFNYYIVDSSHIRLLSTNTISNIGGHGEAELQTGGPFSASSLSGNYVFASRGDDGTGLDSVNTVGEFTATAGAISSGAFDSVLDGTPQSNVAITTGSYTVGANGRVAATFTSGSTIVNRVFWMVSPSRAFFLTASDNADALLTEDGTADLQQTSSFSNASINGQFALVMHGTNPTVFLDRVGTLQWDGSGNLTLNEFVNDTGTTSTPGTLSGTYTAAANGRATGTINSLSASTNDLIFYMISGSDGYVLQEDAGTELLGRVTLQQ